MIRVGAIDWLLPFHNDVQEDETLTEQGTEESVTWEEMGNFFEEGADQTDDIQSFGNITEKAEEIMVRVKNTTFLRFQPF